MPRITDIEGLPVTGVKGRTIGRVTHVLFHPGEPRVVGFEVQPPALGYVVERKPRYVPLDKVEISSAQICLGGERPDLDRDAATRLGFTWDDTVIWRFMPVMSESGRETGLVRDVRFDAESGAVEYIWLTRGATEDVAVGRSEVDGDHVTGFDGEYVRVADEARSHETSGGTAKQAGRATAVAKIAAEETAKQAVGGAVEIARAVKRSEVTKRAAKGWKAFRDSVAEGMRDEEK